MASPILVNGTSGVLATPIFVRGPSKLETGNVFNGSAATAYVQFYDTVLAPTVGTTVPVYSVGVTTLGNAPITQSDAAGLFFKDGMWVAATTTLSGNTAPGVALAVSLGVS